LAAPTELLTSAARSVENPEQPKDKNYGNGNSDQPEKQSLTGSTFFVSIIHGVLLHVSARS
jgi:hypothetical protein